MLKRLATFRLPHWLGIALLVLVLDQITKHSIELYFKLGDTLPVIPGFFNLTLAYNPGAAFSFLADAGGWQRHFFTLLAFGVSAYIIFLLKKHQQETRFALALAMIMGGAIGNAIDRIVFGHVIDFLDFYLGTSHYPAFNLADSAIVGGAMLIIWDSFKQKNKEHAA
ncbi:signal peptidase II [Chitinilyticum piscinae]|uniref:Lipoprotein signal peptidase n=1 Tax=Chitinilyticum piscinae TaxID=2866724 RepID=A0A8J7K8F7_9NEIS|nr:signal peptidase II [Chitinilyticum piscinae]MBE9609448.1 lipoprotein signal peptidase [Chitinilyticum piscinae]